MAEQANFFAVQQADGRVLWQGTCSRQFIGDTTFEGIVILEAPRPIDTEKEYFQDGSIVPRPTTGLPETHTIPASTDWILSDVPAGTEVEVDGEVVGTTDETGLTLSFADPGVWPVTLRPPFPWVEASCEVTVT